MGDSDDNNQPPAASIPAWQQEAKASAASETQEEQSTQQDDHDQQLQVARRFLDEDEVKSASREKKVQFLKTKGISDGDIEKLLGQSETVSESLPTVGVILCGNFP